MTRTPAVLDAITPLIADLATHSSAELRYRRLLETLRCILPSDAAAILRLEGDSLVPLAIQGLSLDTLGRRFKVEEHPRLQAILEASRGIRFPSDCQLPDPYDGLVEAEGADLEVHDCMGCTLKVGDSIWGVLTLDAMEISRFSQADLKILETFASLATATVTAVARLEQLATSIEDERRRAEAYQIASHQGAPQLVGQSSVYRQMVSEIHLVAPSDLTVLVTGETGVGKELVARQIHLQSSRARKSLVSVNCAALPENLVESELFGHVRGAFSGAINDRLGKFELANGGTLFLDEIGELPLNVQAKLLRVLQNGELQRIGSDRENHVDIRLIAATNRDLAEEVRNGRFRADLYHRLSVFPLYVPPLRERGEDILLLAGTFIEENRKRMALRGLRLSADARDELLAYSWPGNVRELEYLIARATLKAKGRTPLAGAAILTIDAIDLDLAPMGSSVSGKTTNAISVVQSAASGVVDLRSAVDNFQRTLIQKSLDTHGGNLAATARALGVDRANLARLTARLDLPVGKKKL